MSSAERIRVKIRGRYWWIVEESTGPDNRGLCDHPQAMNKTIRIDPDQADERERLDTTIHEILHASVWDLAEETVEETATDLAAILWRLGYRRAA